MTDESIEGSIMGKRIVVYQRVPLLLSARFTAAGGALIARFDTNNTATSGLRHLSPRRRHWSRPSMT